MRGEERLWLATLALAVSDLLSAMLHSKDQRTKDLDSARHFVRYYPKIVGKLKSIKSRKQLEDWLSEIERQLEEL